MPSKTPAEAAPHSTKREQTRHYAPEASPEASNAFEQVAAWSGSSRHTLDSAGASRRAIPHLQRVLGNAAVSRLLQRQARSQHLNRSTLAPTQTTVQRDNDQNAAPTAGITLENWPSMLPHAVRATNKKDRSKDENIHVKLGEKEKKDENTAVNEYDKVVKEKVKPAKGAAYEQEYVIHAPTLENADKGLAAPLSDEQQAFIEIIQAARDAFDISKLHLNRYQGKYGWQYGGKPKQDATPTAVQGTADTSTVEGKRKQSEQWIWEELRYEGSSASINAYDSQMITWGRGLGAATGGLNPTMTELFKDPDIAAAFKNVGVSFEKNTWLVVNTATGAIEDGRNALAIMQTDPHILAAMIEIGEREQFKQAIADAQWTGIKAHGTSKVPDFALDWSKEITQLVAHITHWGPAYGWQKAAAGYEASGGDALQVVLHFFRTAAGKANKNGSRSIRKMGPDVISNFSHWGGGIGLKTIKEHFSEASLTNKDIDTNEDYSGYYILQRGGADKSGNIPCYVYDAS